MGMFQKYILLKGNAKNSKPDEVCGIDSYTTYGMCKAPVKYFPHKCGKNSQNCFIDFHSDNFFGLKRTYAELVEKENKDRKAPTVAIKYHNKRKIRVMKKDESK